jgi:tape measure domain-containing protein
MWNMGTIRTAIHLFDGVSSPSKGINKAISTVTNSFESVQRVSQNAFNTTNIQATKVELNRVDSSVEQVDQAIKKASNSQQQFNKGMQDGGSAANGLMEKVRNIAAGIGVAFGINKIIGLADQMTSTTARLNLMNDGLQTTEQLQNMIMRSANASRGSYTETAAAVGKLGILAGSAFKNTAEIVSFAEQMNKQFVIGGSSIQEQTSAMYQLTQAMAAGKLQGDEFRSIMENAPMLAQAIAKYTGKTTGQLREMSADGLITADIIKNAMFSAADKTDAAFKKIPMTFSQVGTIVGNTLLKTFNPVIQTIGKGAQWIYDKWSTLEPIFYGLAAAVAFYSAAMAIQTAVTWLQVAANQALMISMLTNPILWIALAIGVIIAIIYKWIQSVGGIKVAWLIFCDVFISAWESVQIGFMSGVYSVMNMWDMFWLKVATGGTVIANSIGDMKVDVLTHLQNMVNDGIKIIDDFIGLLNKIPGVNIDLIGGMTFASTAAAENEAAKQNRNAILTQMGSDVTAAAASRGVKLSNMKTDAATAAEARQAKIVIAKNEAAEDAAVKTAANTAKMANSMDSLDEDLQYMRDIAERDAVNRFTTAEIRIEQTNHNTINSDMDIDGVMGKWTKDFTEILETTAEGVA